MPKPVLLTVDDDPEVLRAVGRDLRKRYADRYRVVRADSGITALQSVQTLKRRNEAVALLLADQRMPEMNGVEFLNKALAIYPEARRVLLTAYADTDAAIQAINEARIHHYLLKPWDPPEEHLYPVLDDLLEDWHAGYRPVFEGVRVLGHRWSPRSYALRDFLGRNQVPYRWLDAETADRDKEVHEALEVAERDSLKLPAAIFLDNTGLSDPSTAELAAKLGLRTSATTSFYDLLIVGGGPAGLAAGVYGASEGLTTVMIEREAPGGQAGMSSRIENYLGFPSGLSGSELTRRAVTQARRFGVEILAPQEAVGLRVDAGSKFVKLADGVEIGAKSLLIATGVAYRKLDVPGLERLQGAGVYYGAAMTEAASCKDEDVFIVGGANSAGQAAMYFANYARRVVMLVRGSSLASGMSQYLVEQIRQTPNIHVELNSQVTEAFGTERLEAISIYCSTSGETQKVTAVSLFIFIGAAPQTEWLHGAVERDERGFILTGADLIRAGKPPRTWSIEREPWLLEASVPGIFVAGDVRFRSIKRVASGVGEGANAVQFVHQYLGSV
ncbi:MAG: fused response regulator/thioredoxin-disulfide reductase [Acidobacteria bacterium]|nr:MAG: fused response regulator/thioredoxin-disulfide reductase [Acidobacteriota bacterium]